MFYIALAPVATRGVYYPVHLTYSLFERLLFDASMNTRILVIHVTLPSVVFQKSHFQHNAAVFPIMQK